MTKEAALKGFWSSFGLKAYDENTVPDGESAPAFPYITYQNSIGDFGEPVSLLANVWYRSSSPVEINAKAREIWSKISQGGVQIAYDGGTIWITRNQIQTGPKESDDKILRRIISVTAVYNSAD